ncbi:hypothetical protein M0802_010451 [Mischocyttarus mexicanus]|nr:hypothetical protein M0802_010451 [Mischocyttarus mexicanus]
MEEKMNEPWWEYRIDLQVRKSFYKKFHTRTSAIGPTVLTLPHANSMDIVCNIVIDHGIIPKLVELLSSSEITVLTPALRAVGNIATGNDVETDAIISVGGLNHFALLLQHNCLNIVKEAAWTISNITAGTMQQIDHVINANVLRPLCQVLERVMGTRFLSQFKEIFSVCLAPPIVPRSKERHPIVLQTSILTPYTIRRTAKA